jgi:hypothetical protein
VRAIHAIDMGQLQYVLLGASLIFYVIAVARPKRKPVLGYAAGDNYGASSEV